MTHNSKLKTNWLTSYFEIYSDLLYKCINKNFAVDFLHEGKEDIIVIQSTQLCVIYECLFLFFISVNQTKTFCLFTVF